jgi:hypothetical protein
VEKDDARIKSGGRYMSFIVKGIDFPKEGELLTVSIYNGFISVYTATPKDTVIEHKAQAIQIPKGHGRIIDEKEAIRGWCKGCAFNDGTCGKDETICEDKEMCKYAPTILDKERE